MSEQDQERTLNSALTLLRNGYVPLRIERGQKAARSQGWQTDTPSEEKLHRALARPSNLGIRCGDAKADNTRLVGIDVDLEEPQLISCVERAIGQRVPAKRGAKGATYFVRLDKDMKTHKIPWVRDGKKKPAIDLLARGAQTVVPPSIHPDTGKEYRWLGGLSLEDVPYLELPVFGETLIDEIRGFCKNPDDPIFALNSMEWLGVGGGGNTHDVCLAAVSSMIARKWPDSDIHERINRAKREACEASGEAYDWPGADKAIQEWIDSARDKKFDVVNKQRSDDVPLEMINRYVYVVELDHMMDRNKGQLLNMHKFNNVHARDLPKPWVSMMVHPDLVIVDKLTYAPGQPAICKESSANSEHPLICYNTYYGPDIDPVEGDVEPFLDLARDVFDHNADAFHHAMSFFAHMVQYPGERINHALVIQGSQGIGKDSILLALESVLGRYNCNTVTLQHIESQFNDWAFGKQMIVFSEVLAAGRRAIYNKCKNYVTDELLSINTKHLAIQRLPNRANYIFVTNYKYALSIDPSDRRFWVWYSSMKRKTPQYYVRFYNWLANKHSANALLHYLLTYNVGEFNPKAPPPMTDAKKSMIRASSSEVEQVLREAYEAYSWPMTYDLVSVNHIVAALRPLMRVSMSMVTEALDNIVGEDTELSTRPRFGGSRPRLRAIRNHEHWDKAPNDEVVKYYQMPVPPQAGQTEGGYEEYNSSGSNSPKGRDDF